MANVFWSYLQVRSQWSLTHTSIPEPRQCTRPGRGKGFSKALNRFTMSAWEFYPLLVHRITVSEDTWSTDRKCQSICWWLPMAPALPVQQDQILFLPAQGREFPLWALNLQWQWEQVKPGLSAPCPRSALASLSHWGTQPVQCDTLWLLGADPALSSFS